MLFPFAPGHLWAWLVANPLAQAVLATNLVLVVELKIYHDTAVVGGWDRVVEPQPRVVPDVVRAAADTNDPPGTAVASVRSMDDGERLLLVGTVERRYGDVVRLQDDLVTTRGRAFLAVAVLVGLCRRLLHASAIGVVGAAFLWVAVLSILT